MSGYKEQQEEELEALQSIYPEEYTELSRDPAKFEIIIKPEEVEADDINSQNERLVLKFTLPDTYPDVPPEITIAGPGLTEALIDEIQARLEEKAIENLGMVMCFLLASEAKEWIDARRQSLQDQHDARNIEKLKQKAEEEAKFAGTPVTIQNFLEWRSKFEAEQRAQLLKEHKEVAAKASRKTGRQLFETDKNMAASDAAYMEEGDEGIDVAAERALAAQEGEVDVDETLFEDDVQLEFSDEDD
eukprot:comp9573_c0_seq1/m.4588 comp9573_c0_seq1/g.4588  ORF comp9573_c0_seq1/g.4588 comp9573_c0_seq1/m.4588 type:complete len:245 (-) comp9573_c0_seq1:60-794(-)